MPDEPEVIVAHGDIDADTLAPLAEALDRAATAQQAIILDAGDITFADSSALNMLLRTHQATTLLVAAPSASVRRLLEITGADRFLNVYPTTAAAREAIRGTDLPLAQ